MRKTDLELTPAPPPPLVLACTSCPWWVDKYAEHAERDLAKHARGAHNRWPTRVEQTGRTVGWAS